MTDQDRQTLEGASRMRAGVLDETDNYYLVRVLGSIDMYVMKGDESVTPHLVKDGFWESWISLWMINNIDDKTSFYDVGANTGYYSMLAISRGAQVKAYEPNPAYFQMLKETKDRHGESAWNLMIYPYAISDKTGRATLHVPAKLHGSASLTAMDEKWEYKKIDVKTIPLYLGGMGNHIVKIDAEGAEEKIWAGMEDDLAKSLNLIILMEYTPGAYSDEFLDRLEAYAPLRWINHSGEEEAIDREWISRQDDWFMMVLRKQ